MRASIVEIRFPLTSLYASARYLRALVLATVVLPPFLGQSPPAGSAAAPSTEIKSLLEKQVQGQHLVGIAAIVFRSHTIVGMATSGIRHQGESAQIGPADFWHLGSNTKAMTATMIGRLVDAGALSWTTTPLDVFPELPVPYMLPAGGMAMTLGEYVKFLQMNLRGLRGEDSAFLSAKTIQRLHSSPMHDQYALGWEIGLINGVRESTHSGSDGSFYALMGLRPSQDVGVAVVLNSAGSRSGAAARASLRSLLREYPAAPR